MNSFGYSWQIRLSNQTKGYTMREIKNVFQLSYYVVTEVEMETPDEIMSKA